MPNKRVEVDLYLRANTDLKRLQSALDGFSRDLGSVGGDSDRVRINPAASTEGIQSRLDSQRQQRGAPSSSGGAPDGGAPAYTGRAGAFGRLLGFQDNRSMATNLGRSMGLNSPLGEAMAFGPQIIANVGGLASKVSQIGTGGGFTTAGAQMGLSASGGITSPAFMAGVHQTLARYSQAYGIGQPGGTSLGSMVSAFRNQSLGDLSNLQGGLSDLGFYGKTQQNMLRAGSSKTLEAIPAELRADLFNSTRYGTASISGLASQLRSMGDDATAAHMSVGQFSQSVQEVISSLGGQFGTPQAALLGAARGASLATGLAPSAALGGVNQMTMFQSLAQHAGGAHPFTSTFGSASGIEGAAINSYNMIVRVSGMGNNLDDAKRFLQRNGRAATLEALWRSYTMARSLWPQNMTPPMFMQIIQRGMAGVTAGFNLSRDVQVANKQEGHGAVSNSLLHSIEHEGITALGGGSKAEKAIQNAINQGGNRGQIARRIQSVVAKANQQQSNDRAGGKFTITLAGAAADHLNIQPADSSTRNQTQKSAGGRAITYMPGTTPLLTK